jgi:hypothetical protein
MTFYAKNFLELKDDLIMWPLTRFGIICMGLGSPLGWFRVGLHQLWLEVELQSLDSMGG